MTTCAVMRKIVHMPTKKIADEPPMPCRHPEHKPPSMRVFELGTYEHTCPACGQKTVFTVRGAYL